MTEAMSAQVSVYTLGNSGLSTYGAKTSYQRNRPFMVNGAPMWWQAG